MKKGNNYARMIDSNFFDKCPKTVLAAFAVALLLKQGEARGSITQALLDEWNMLHGDGIVPQKPSRVGIIWYEG